MNRPRLSIGLPVYNGENFLSRALESLLAQTFTDFELIVSDNGSTDSTVDICRRFAASDDRIKLHRNDINRGAAWNYNRVVELATGEFFTWANHDDLWLPTYSEKCIAQLDRHPTAVLAYARSIMIDEEGEEVTPLLSGLALDLPNPYRRLRRFHDLLANPTPVLLEFEGLWIPVYGVIRLLPLRQTELIGPYISSDTVLLEELLLHGEFLEVDGWEFYKREHASRSVRASDRYDKRIQWFTGRPTPQRMFPRWRLFYERWRSVLRTRMSSYDRARCLAETLAFNLGRRHGRRILWLELRANLQSFLTRRDVVEYLSQS